MYTAIQHPTLDREIIINKSMGLRHKWLLALSVASLAFYFSGPALRYVDAAAAVVDIGILSLPILSALALLGFIGISTWLSHLLWPSFRRFRQHHFEHHFTTLEPWQKIAFYMAGFFLLLYACIACLAALL